MRSGLANSTYQSQTRPQTKGVERVGRVVEAVGGQRRVDILADAAGLAEDPAVDGQR
jgi:hypothetical protein